MLKLGLAKKKSKIRKFENSKIRKFENLNLKFKTQQTATSLHSPTPFSVLAGYLTWARIQKKSEIQKFENSEIL